jgi:hypothetical protein
MLEAMYLGSLVISTPAGGAREVIRTGENGFIINFDDISSLTSLLVELYNYPEKKKRIVSQARETVLAKFRIERMVEDIEEFVREVCIRKGIIAGIMKNVKVLHYNSARGWRGGEQQTEYLIRGLGPYSIEQYAAGKPGEEFLQRISPFVKEILPLQSKNELSVGSVMTLSRFIREKNINIVHVHTPHAHAHAFYAHVLGTDFKLVAHRRVDFKIKK